jgi:hypothetical protein
MRTAEDVIKRLQWDVVDGAMHGFSVGYLDRFLGVIEEPFESREGLWRDVPQHRIQWFKYGGATIWEKETRTDFVFGTANGNGKRLPEVVCEVNAAISASEDDPSASDADADADAAATSSSSSLSAPSLPSADATTVADPCATLGRSRAPSSASTDSTAWDGATAAADASPSYAMETAAPYADSTAVTGGDSFQWADTSWADDGLA